MTRRNQDGYEPFEIAPAMVDAGVAAFVDWFRQQHLEGLLVGLPEDGDLRELAQRMFLSMMSASRDV